MFKHRLLFFHMLYIWYDNKQVKWARIIGMELERTQVFRFSSFNEVLVNFTISVHVCFWNLFEKNFYWIVIQRFKQYKNNVFNQKLKSEVYKLLMLFDHIKKCCFVCFTYRVTYLVLPCSFLLNCIGVLCKGIVSLYDLGGKKIVCCFLNQVCSCFVKKQNCILSKLQFLAQCLLHSVG